MCEATTVITLMGMAFAAREQHQNANAQLEAAEDSSQLKANQTSDRLQQETSERVLEAQRNRSRMIVAAGESGIQLSSNSFEAEMSNSFAQQNKDLGIIQKNALNSGLAINAEANEATAGLPSSLQIGATLAADSAGVYSNRPPESSGLQIRTKGNGKTS